MRQITKILAMALMALLFTGSAWAYTSTFNLGTIGLQTNEFEPKATITFDQFLNFGNGGIFPLATITQQLGGDGVLSDGDKFSEFGLLGVLGTDGSGISFITNDGNNKASYLYYEFIGLSGWIDQVAGNIFNINFFPNVGQINLRYNTSGDTFVQSATDTIIATFNLESAGATNFNFTTGVANSGFGVNYKLDTVLIDNFWIFEGNAAETHLNIAGNAELTATILGENSTMAGKDGYITYSIQNVGQTSYTPVPEPGTLLLLGAGLLGLGAVARRRKN